jgi:glycosyltransferase involved in cell wall biosynthesis
LKISIITVCYNSVNTIRDTIESVLNQTYSDIEHIVIDGQSTDGTAELIASYGNRIDKFISEPDAGIYNAMNKGLRISAGEVVGILNADDFLHNDTIIEKIAASFNEWDIDAVYGDVRFVKYSNPEKVVRYYSSKKFKIGKFKYGYMPAHPSFYVRRECFDKYGFYREDYRIGADFDLLVRFMYKEKIRCKYLEFPFVTMRRGGVSNKSLGSIITLNREIARACRENGISTNYMNIYSKYFTKPFEFMRINSALK